MTQPKNQRRDEAWEKFIADPLSVSEFDAFTAGWDACAALSKKGRV